MEKLDLCVVKVGWRRRQFLTALGRGVKTYSMSYHFIASPLLQGHSAVKTKTMNVENVQLSLRI